jgi:hypothetical protein
LGNSPVVSKWRIDPVTDTRSQPELSIALILITSLWSMLLAAQEKRESRYTVGRKAVISVTNDYGSIKVGPSADRRVVVTTVTRSGTPSFASEQHGNRIDIRSILNSAGAGLVEYTILVPDNSVVSLHSSDGSLQVQGLGGDIIVETLRASVDVTKITQAHLHVRTFGGPVNLNAVRNSHVDVHSVKGDVSLRDVTGSSVRVDSGSGQITYAGDPGPGGDYILTSNSGNIGVSIPAGALAEIKTRSLHNDSHQEPRSRTQTNKPGHSSLFLKSGSVPIPRFFLRSIRGGIQVQHP